MTGHLGKLPAKSHPDTALLHRYVVRANLPAPTSLDLSKRITQPWGMCLNDSLGDCTIAGVKHLIQLHTTLAGAEFDMPDQDVLAGYERFGYNPADPSTDRGAVMTDVLASWKQTGFDGHFAPGWGAVPIKDHQMLRAALNVFAGLYLGVELPAAAQGMTDEWAMPANPASPDAQPGSWGGHCVVGVAYDETSISVVTWGKVVKVDNAFWDAYFSEAYVVVSPDMIGAAGTDFAGFNLDQLYADLGLLQQPTPNAPSSGCPKRPWWRHLFCEILGG